MSGAHDGTQEDATCQSGVVFFSNPLMSDVESDWSPLHDAAFNGRILTLGRLLAQGACVNLHTLDKATPLHGACTRGHAACAKLLVENGANVNSATVDGHTALTEACSRGHVTCVSLLLQHGAASRGTGPSGSPIHSAAARGHAESIEPLVRHGADVDQHVDELGSPLQVACSNQRLGAVKKLLQLGASVNGGVRGDAPLHIAARLSSPELVSVLLDRGADTFLLDREGRRPAELSPPGSRAEELLRQAGGVFPLMQLCRIRIRRTVGKQRLGGIRDLHLPADLIQYLLFQSDPGGGRTH